MSKRAGRFGTFGGVFTPSVLTILGVIMFMRTGHVIGNVGLYKALIILVIAKSITTLTTLSVSAIATNTEVGTGGNYFMISRTLGAGIGGTVGVTLFISQAIAIAFYVIGFTEALVLTIESSAPDTALWIVDNGFDRFISCGVIIGLFALTFKGADLALKAQYIILAVLLASVASFLIGGFLNFDAATLKANTWAASKQLSVVFPTDTNANGPSPLETIGFWAAFAIFFPAATGIDAGANMSGDLKDPAESIPKGTLWAILFTGTVYLLLITLMAGFTPARNMIGDLSFPALQAMSIFAPLVVAGVFAATLSSALSSFLGAPRILQAMGKDKIIKPVEYFGVGHGKDDEPRRATVLSLVIALAVVFAGSLDVIAEIISMFFLIAYGMINLSAFVEAKAGNPSFRPRFKAFGATAAMTGAIGCGVAMIKINETYAIIAIILAGLIYFTLRGTKGQWEDATRGYTFSRMRDNLFELHGKTVDAKNWRLQLTALTKDADRDIRMIRAGGWLESKRGLFSILEAHDPSALGGEASGASQDKQRQWLTMRQKELAQLMSRSHINALPQVIFAPTPSHVDSAVQAHSIGPLRPNTLIATLPPPGQPQRRQWLFDMARQLHAQRPNLILYKGTKDLPESRQLDVWWSGEKNGSLMALLAYLVAQHPDWQGGRTRLLRIVRDSNEQAEAEASLTELTEAARLETSIEVILSPRPVGEVIAEHSAGAGLVFLGLAERSLLDLENYVDMQHQLLASLPPTLLIHSNGSIDLLA